MSILVSILLTIGILSVVVCALINLRKAKTATPANRAMMHNTARMFWSIGAIFAGGLLGGIVTAPLSIPAIGWIIVPGLVVATLALLVTGIVWAIICTRRIGPINSQIWREANPWTPRP